MKSSKEKPFVLLAAELIYLKVYEIKKKNPDFSIINAIESFIGSDTYNEISSGNFHNELILKLKKNNFIDKKTKKKIPDQISRTILCQKSFSSRNIATCF